MKELLILRHAKSSWDDPRLSDFERPLAKRGLHDAPRMGALLAREELRPDLIISSAARRAAATAALAAEACDYAGQITETRDLYMAGPEAYLDMLRVLPDEISRVMVVGHNPGVEELLEETTGIWERMPTAALALVTYGIVSWADIDEVDGRLVTLWRPKELGSER